MGLLDVQAPSTFTVAWADGSRWTAPAGERYTLDNGVLTIFRVDNDGTKLAGARHYSAGDLDPRDRPPAYNHTGAAAR